MKWTDLPDQAGTWFKFYHSRFQGYEYVVMGPQGAEYSRIPGCLLDRVDEGYRWLGPVPLDPEAPEDRSKRDVL